MPEHNLSNPVNNAPVKETRNRSRFDLSHFLFGTHRFANYNINFARDVVSKGNYPLRASDVVDSYTLKAPLMQDIQKTKEYFFVPKQAILPINWDKIERLPALGDDVDASRVNSTIVDFQNRHITQFANLFFNPQSALSLNDALAVFIRKLLFTELFFSQGSLLSACGAHLSPMLYFSVENVGNRLDFDAYFDSFFTQLSTLLSVNNLIFNVYFNNEQDVYIINPDISYPTSNAISMHRFLELARDNYDFIVRVVGPAAGINSVTALLNRFYPLGENAETVCTVTFDRGEGDPLPQVDFSIDRCAAYQIVCAHYFSNDSIDYIHDADLWRQNMLSLVSRASDYNDSSYSDFVFSYNGVDTLYDVLSSFWVSKMLGFVVHSTFELYEEADEAVFGYFINLLAWRRSLRFGDYFVGAKARPLAIGDFSVAVNNNAVSVVDVTKKISLQRLANNVNRIGNSIKEWYQKIMGSDLAYDYHNPMWLASTRDTVYAVKNENTNNADVEKLNKVNTSANFAGRDSAYEFTFSPDRNGVVIGITYYDIRRAYCFGIQRMMQHVDRFDGFIPDLQYIGDQDINGNELVAGYGSTFAYTLRNMEYKQYYDECYGGFAVDKLPGFNFKFKPEFYEEPDSGSTGFSGVLKPISPEFIRSRCDEFDQFYISLAGYSDASYFHFIVRTFNDMSRASQPMVYAPQIL